MAVSLVINFIGPAADPWFGFGGVARLNFCTAIKLLSAFFEHAFINPSLNLPPKDLLFSLINFTLAQ